MAKHNDFFCFENLFNGCVIIWHCFHFYIFFLPLDTFKQNQRDTCVPLVVKDEIFKLFFSFYSFCFIKTLHKFLKNILFIKEGISLKFLNYHCNNSDTEFITNEDTVIDSLSNEDENILTPNGKKRIAHWKIDHVCCLENFY